MVPQQKHDLVTNFWTGEQCRDCSDSSVLYGRRNRGVVSKKESWIDVDANEKLYQTVCDGVVVLMCHIQAKRKTVSIYEISSLGHLFVRVCKD
jgi:hypothetical protein